MTTTKREEYIHWDVYFMGLAAVPSFRSKDPSTQNGACIVDPESMTPLSLGYNGLPRGCSDDEFPWAREAEKEEDTKYPYCEHAERNAIYNAAQRGIALRDSVIYIYSEKGYYPCAPCARGIIQSGIKEVVMGFAIRGDTDVYNWAPSLRMFKAAGVKVRVMISNEAPAESVYEAIKDFDLLARKFAGVKDKMEVANNG